MTERYHELAEQLESYGSSRADFRTLAESERLAIAKWLFIARVQVKTRTLDRSDWSIDRWRNELARKKDLYIYECGRAGIDYDKATLIWNEYVYDGAATPQKNEYLL